MQSFDLTQLDEFPLDGMLLPRIRMYSSDLPDIHIEVGGQPYQYDRSYPAKGYSAVLPAIIRAAMAEGKQPLVIERPERFYVYFQTEIEEEPAAAEAAPEDEAASPETLEEAEAETPEPIAAEAVPEKTPAESETPAEEKGS